MRKYSTTRTSILFIVKLGGLTFSKLTHSHGLQGMLEKHGIKRMTLVGPKNCQSEKNDGMLTFSALLFKSLLVYEVDSVNERKQTEPKRRSFNLVQMAN